MTDGSLFIGDDGQEYKMFNTQDGLGMRLLKKVGLSLQLLPAGIQIASLFALKI